MLTGLRQLLSPVAGDLWRKSKEGACVFSPDDFIYLVLASLAQLPALSDDTFPVASTSVTLLLVSSLSLSLSLSATCSLVCLTKPFPSSFPLFTLAAGS